MGIQDDDRSSSTAFSLAADPFRLLVESVTDYAIYLVDLDGLIASWNTGAERIKGYAAAEIIGQPFELMFSSEDRASGKPRQHMSAALALGKVEEEGQRCRKDGSLFWALYTITALREGERHVGFSVFVRDITERRRQEELVRLGESRLRTALTAGRMGAWTWDLAANRSTWNDREFELFDLPPSDGPIDTDRMFERVHPADLPALKLAVAAAVEHGTPFRAEFRIVRPGGEVRWLAGAGQVSRDATGVPLEIYGVNFDITEQKVAEAALRASEEQFRSFMDHTPAQVWIDDEDGVNRFANTALVRELGRPVEEITNRRMADFMPASSPIAAYLLDNQQVFASGRHDPIIVDAPRHDGTLGRFLIHKFPIGFATDRPRRLGGVAIDVTERERAVEALHASEERFRLLVECVKDFAIYTLAPDGIIETWNDAAARLYGYAAAEIIGQHRRVLFTAEDVARGAPQRELDLARANGKASEETWRVRKDGSRFWSNGTMSALYDEAGNVRGFVKIVRDLTERKHAHDALREIQQRLDLATRSARMGVWEWNVLTNELVWDARMYELYGLGIDQFSGAYDAWQRGLHPEDRADSEAALAAALHAGDGFHTEFRVVWPDGEVRDIEAHGLVRRADDGTATHVVGVNWDITNRKRAERDLRLRDRAIQAVSQGIVITDPNAADNPIIYASQGFGGITGYAPASILGQNCRFLQGSETDPATVRLMSEAIAAGRECSVEVLNYKLDGTPFWNALFMTPIRDDSGKLVHFVGVQADVTARRSLERALQQSQKMEAVGRLAGGVAHDFNNLLSVILSYASLALDELQPGAQFHDEIKEIETAARRAAGLTRQLLAFSRQQVLQPRVLDLAEIVSAMRGMLGRLLGEDIELHLPAATGKHRVLADPSQIEQVVMNLAVNARDAMPVGGALTIEVADVRVDASAASMPGALPAGDYVMLAVVDTGSGMDAKTLSHVFEPFFTTKEPGKGTGLGLATVFGIVQQSSGVIRVYSEPGRGTAFKIYLPRTDRRADAPSSPHPARQVRGASETVLLVEDEAQLRAVAHAILRRHGYRVLEASNGVEASLIAKAFAGEIDILVTDVVMPQMSGRVLAEQLALGRPAIKVLFMSGYTDDAIVRHGIVEAGVAFLQKPFTPDVLLRRVREVLDGAALR